jgi:hypothetical protein
MGRDAARRGGAIRWKKCRPSDQIADRRRGKGDMALSPHITGRKIESSIPERLLQYGMMRVMREHKLRH